MRELVDSEEDNEYAAVARLDALLAPPPSLTTNSSESARIMDACSLMENLGKTKTRGYRPKMP